VIGWGGAGFFGVLRLRPIRLASGSLRGFAQDDGIFFRCDDSLFFRCDDGVFFLRDDGFWSGCGALWLSDDDDFRSIAVVVGFGGFVVFGGWEDWIG
jgi:hypothetical protein